MSKFLTRHTEGSTGQALIANENYLLMEVLSGANPVKGIVLNYNIPGISISNAAEKVLTYDTSDGATAVTPAEGDAYIVANWATEIRFRNDAPGSLISGAAGTPLDASGNPLANAVAANGIDLATCLPSDWRAADNYLPLPGDLMIYTGAEWLCFTPQDGWTVTMAQDARETDICYNPVLNVKADGTLVAVDGDGDTHYSNVNEIGSPSRGMTLTYKTAKTFNGATQGYEDWLFLTPKDQAATSQPTVVNVATTAHAPSATAPTTTGTISGRWTRDAVVTVNAGNTPADGANYAISAMTADGDGVSWNITVDSGATVGVGDIISYARSDATAYLTGTLGWTLTVLTASNTSGDNWNITVMPSRANFNSYDGSPISQASLSALGWDETATPRRGGSLKFSNNDLGLCDTGTFWYMVPNTSDGDVYQCKNFYAKQRTWKSITSASGGSGAVDNAIKTVTADAGSTFNAVGEDTFNIRGSGASGITTSITSDNLTISQSAASASSSGYMSVAEYRLNKAVQYWLDDPVLKGFGTTDPPSSPSEGDKYLVGSPPTGVWASGGYALKVVVYVGSTWVIVADVTHGLTVCLGNETVPEGLFSTYPAEFAGKTLVYDSVAQAFYPTTPVTTATPHFTGKYQYVGSTAAPVYAKCFEEGTLETTTGTKFAIRDSDTVTTDGNLKVVTAAPGTYGYDILGVRHAIWDTTTEEFFLIFDNQSLRNTFFNPGNDQSGTLDIAFDISLTVLNTSALSETDTLPLDTNALELTAALISFKGLSAYAPGGSEVGLYWASGTLTPTTASYLDAISTLQLRVNVINPPDHYIPHGLSISSSYPRSIDATFARGTIHFALGGVLKLGGSEFVTAAFVTNTNIVLSYPEISTPSSKVFARLEYTPQ